jgi:hypothetical protein
MASSDAPAAPAPMASSRAPWTRATEKLHNATDVTDATLHGGGRAPITTTRLYIRILRVFLGTATATLYSRLVSVGPPVLRGVIGAGFDEASWIPTVPDPGIMIIGPFSVCITAFTGDMGNARRRSFQR